MKCHTHCRDEIEHIDCLQMSAERLFREWNKDHPGIKVKGSGSIKKKEPFPDQTINVCLFIVSKHTIGTNNSIRIFESPDSSKKAKRRAKKAKKAAQRAKSLPATSRETLNELETSTLRSLNISNRTASTLFAGSTGSIPSTIHESENLGSTTSMNTIVVSYHNWY